MPNPNQIPKIPKIQKKVPSKSVAQKKRDGTYKPSEDGQALPDCEGELFALPWLKEEHRPYFDNLKAMLAEKTLDRVEFNIVVNKWASSIGKYIEIKQIADKTEFLDSKGKINSIHHLLDKQGEILDKQCRMFGFTPDTFGKLVTEFEKPKENNPFADF